MAVCWWFVRFLCPAAAVQAEQPIAPVDALHSPLPSWAKGHLGCRLLPPCVRAPSGSMVIPWMLLASAWVCPVVAWLLGMVEADAWSGEEVARPVRAVGADVVECSVAWMMMCLEDAACC